MKIKKILKRILKEEEVQILIGPISNKDFKNTLGDRDETSPFYEGFARGVMTIDGTLYIPNDSSSVMHTQFIRKLNSKGIISDNYVRTWNRDSKSLNEFVSVLSYNNKTWSLPGTYMIDKFPKELKAKYSNLFKKIGYSFLPKEE